MRRGGEIEGGKRQERELVIGALSTEDYIRAEERERETHRCSDSARNRLDKKKGESKGRECL